MENLYGAILHSQMPTSLPGLEHLRLRSNYMRRRGDETEKSNGGAITKEIFFRQIKNKEIKVVQQLFHNFDDETPQ